MYLFLYFCICIVSLETLIIIWMEPFVTTIGCLTQKSHITASTIPPMIIPTVINNGTIIQNNNLFLKCLSIEKHRSHYLLWSAVNTVMVVVNVSYSFHIHVITKINLNV